MGATKETERLHVRVPLDGAAVSSGQRGPAQAGDGRWALEEQVPPGCLRGMPGVCWPEGVLRTLLTFSLRGVE